MLEPLVEAMHMEGYYQMKPACYDSPEINPDVPYCFQGSKFISNYTQDIMGDS